MPYHVVITGPVSEALGGLGLDRRVLLKVFNRLYEQLGSHADPYRGRRDPEDPDLFFYDMRLWDGARWHSLYFSVDDRQATDYLFVVAVAYEADPSF
ncbi:MAG TPA: hypothetical protein VJ739_09100 [Gemmataceae bacterium]|nr:hypothetical protein [Gemmataceae bacterium]